MTVPGLQEELRAGDAETVERFAEEVLRLYPSVHFTRRRANEDFELGGQRIKRDDALLMLDAGANRDPARFTCPHEIDLSRDGWREHLAFSIGPRTCAGAALARAEVQESVAKALERLPNLRLDPDAEPPRLAGLPAALVPAPARAVRSGLGVAASRLLTVSDRAAAAVS